MDISGECDRILPSYVRNSYNNNLHSLYCKNGNIYCCRYHHNYCYCYFWNPPPDPFIPKGMVCVPRLYSPPGKAKSTFTFASAQTEFAAFHHNEEATCPVVRSCSAVKSVTWFPEWWASDSSFTHPSLSTHFSQLQSIPLTITPAQILLNPFSLLPASCNCLILRPE